MTRRDARDTKDDDADRDGFEGYPGAPDEPTFRDDGDLGPQRGEEAVDRPASEAEATKRERTREKPSWTTAWKLPD